MMRRDAGANVGGRPHLLLITSSLCPCVVVRRVHVTDSEGVAVATSTSTSSPVRNPANNSRPKTFAAAAQLWRIRHGLRNDIHASMRAQSGCRVVSAEGLWRGWTRMVVGLMYNRIIIYTAQLCWTSVCVVADGQVDGGCAKPSL